MTAMEHVIETSKLTKHYGVVRAVTELDLAVRRGEIYGFLGPNGAGKTTTIRLLLDLIRPTSGSMHVLGLDPRRDAVAIKRRIGYVPGEMRLYDRMTPRELIRFSGRVRGDAWPKRASELAERFQCPLDDKIGALSHGNRQKAGVLLALAHDPELLILDEPTQGLDPLMQHEFTTLLRELRRAGRTVFLSSHDLSEVEQACDRIGMIRTGQMMAAENVDEMRARAVRGMEIRFAAPPPSDAFAGLDGVIDVKLDGAILRCKVTATPDALIKAAARFTVLEMTSHEPSLEEIFLALYESEALTRAS